MRELSEMKKRAIMMDRRFYLNMGSTENLSELAIDPHLQKTSRLGRKELLELNANKSQLLDFPDMDASVIKHLLNIHGDDVEKGSGSAVNTRSRRTSISSYNKDRRSSIIGRAQQAVNDMAKWKDQKGDFITKDSSDKDGCSLLSQLKKNEDIESTGLGKEDRKFRNVAHQEKLLRKLMQQEQEFQLSQMKKFSTLCKNSTTDVDKINISGNSNKRRRSSFDQQKLLKGIEANLGVDSSCSGKSAVRRDSVRRASNSHEIYGILRDAVKANTNREMAYYSDYKDRHRDSTSVISKCRYIRLPQHYQTDMSEPKARSKSSQKSSTASSKDMSMKSKSMMTPMARRGMAERTALANAIKICKDHNLVLKPCS